MPHINDAGLNLIREFEGLDLRAYPDPGTGGEPWTIGYGHTANVHPGQTCTIEQATRFLVVDVSAAEREVASCVQVVLTPNQFSALVSFEYNTGALRHSTLLHDVNSKDWNAAESEFGRWVHAGGEVMAGLVRRRAAEAALFATVESE